MRQQEVTFKCSKCKHDLKFGVTTCYTCGSYVWMWDKYKRVYQDKYLEIYEIWI